MPVEIAERKKRRRLTGKSAERLYLIRGATSEAEARTALLAAAEVPTTVNGWPRVVADFGVDEIEENLFEGVASWANPNYDPSQQEIGEFSYSFDISGQTQHITHSIATVSSDAAPGSAHRNFHGAINVQPNGDIGGVDVSVPVFNFTMSLARAVADVDMAYVLALANLVGRTNDDTFQGFAAGELLFTSVHGTRQNDEKWNIDFGFARMPNKEDIVLNAGTVREMTVPSKKGWEYLWCYFDTFEDVSNHTLVKFISNYYVEKVNDEGDFTVTGLAA